MVRSLLEVQFSIFSTVLPSVPVYFCLRNMRGWTKKKIAVEAKFMSSFVPFSFQYINLIWKLYFWMRSRRSTKASRTAYPVRLFFSDDDFPFSLYAVMFGLAVFSLLTWPDQIIIPIWSRWNARFDFSFLFLQAVEPWAKHEWNKAPRS